MHFPIPITIVYFHFVKKSCKSFDYLQQDVKNHYCYLHSNGTLYRYKCGLVSFLFPRAISWHTLILPGISLLLERCVGKSIFKMRFAACKKGEKLCVDVLSVFIGECSSIWQSVITQGITEITFLHVSVRAWLAAAKLTSVGISCLLLLCLISCLVTGRCCWLVG